MKRLILWTNLLALAACARAIPPAPNGISPVSAIPGVRVPYLERAAPREIAADSSVNDLADAQPDAAGVPEFLPDDVRWDIDVRSFANHPRVQYYLNYFQGISRTGLSVFLARGARYEPMIRRAIRGGRASGRPGISRTDRERLLQRGGEPLTRSGDVAVHEGNRPRLRDADRYLGGRAPGPGEGDRGGSAVPAASA